MKVECKLRSGGDMPTPPLALTHIPLRIIQLAKTGYQTVYFFGSHPEMGSYLIFLFCSFRYCSDAPTT